MRIVIHDYPGHAFPVQLSRYLANIGHDVWHIWSSDIEAPRGALEPQADDPENLHLCPLTLGQSLPKYNLVKRFLAEKKYAKEFINFVAPLDADMIISNPSPFIQGDILKWCSNNDVTFISWLQDIYHIPIGRVLTNKFGALGSLLTKLIKHYELTVMKKSDHVIVISDAFKEFLTANNLDAGNISVIPNWAVLDEIKMLPKSNGWSKSKNLENEFVYLYAGTLGLKHNPQMLVELACNIPESKLVVITQGIGRSYLDQAKAKQNISNLILLDYQPFESLGEVLASADILLALLEPEAGAFSVPSKILSYMCANRPILAAIPQENAAAKNITKEGAGLTVNPDDIKGFIAAAKKLYQDKNLRMESGQAGRSYAEQNFCIKRIGDGFEKLFAKTLRSKT